MAKGATQEEQLFFVGIRDHVDIRKEVLQSSRSLLDSLKRYELYRRVKDDKLRAQYDLKRVFDELLVINKKLRGKLPKVPIKVPDVPVREDVPVRQVQKGKPQEQMPEARSPQKSKLDLLEEELAKIEEKLGELE